MTGKGKLNKNYHNTYLNISDLYLLMSFLCFISEITFACSFIIACFMFKHKTFFIGIMVLKSDFTIDFSII